MKILSEKLVSRPVSDVFERFTDLENAAETVRGIEKLELLTDGPVGAGTRFRETRIFFKREATEEMEITEFHPNESYVVGCESCGSVYRTEFRFRPEGEGTKVTMSFQARPVSFFAKLMTPLGFLMSGSIRKAVDQDMEDLKASLENENPTLA